jgi:FtsZ-interacting cell division protein ZipA
MAMLILVVGALMVAAVVVIGWQLRDRVDPIARHARAISALRDIAQSRRSEAEPTRSGEPVGGVRLLQEAPSPSGPKHRRSDPGNLQRNGSSRTRRAPVTPTPQRLRKGADRPTIATIPTIGWRPSNGLAPTAEIVGSTIDNAPDL